MLIKRKSIEAESNHRAGPTAAKKTAARKPRFAPITLSEHDGVRYLHFGTEWVQGAMRLRKPDWLELEYAQQMMAWMLLIDQPSHLLQLGLGSAALTKFCYRHFPDAKITAVDLNPAVIAICESMFKLPPNDDRLHVLEMDAAAFVTDSANHQFFDAIQVDLYDATARGPVLDSAEFYQQCAACLQAHGVLTVNLFGDHPSFAKNLKAMRFAFEQVLCLPPVHDGNVVAIALKTRTVLDFDVLMKKANEIKKNTRLPAPSWVNGLKQSVSAG